MKAQRGELFTRERFCEAGGISVRARAGEGGTRAGEALCQNVRADGRYVGAAGESHGGGKARAQILDIGGDAVTAPADSGSAEGAADKYRLRAQGKHFKYVHSVTDTAVCKHIHTTAHGFDDFRQYFRRARSVIKYTAAVIGHDNGIDSRVGGNAGLVFRHDALDHELAARAVHAGRHVREIFR